MTLKDVFAIDRRVIARGGVVPVEAGSCRQWFSDLSRRGLELFDSLSPGITTIPQPYVDFVASRTISAFAFMVGRDRFIAIHAGILKLFWTYNVLLSTPGVLRRVGNVGLERAHPRVDLRIQNISKNPTSTIRQPLDPVRAEFAQQLSMIGFDFLVAHEIAHHLHGHLDFLGANRATDSLTRHALELDADHFAVNTVMNQVLGLAARKGVLPPPASEIYSTDRRALFVAMLALCVLYRLHWLHDTTFWNIDEPEQSHRSHTPMPIRTLALMASVAARVQHDERLAPLRRRVNTVVTMAGLHAEVGLQRMRGAPVNVPDGFWATGSPPTMQYVERLNKRWTELRPKLQKFSYTLLPEVAA